MQRAEESRREGDVIVTLHLSFFLNSTREYFVPADLPLLIDWVRESVDEIVTFVDDIYDVHQSLMGGPAGVGMIDPPLTLEATIHNLIQILDWRSVEGMLASSLSSSTTTQHYQFAVKHPAETFHDLLYSPKPVIYLSHPISELRRLVIGGNEDEARGLVNRMQGVVSRLRGSATVIEPTAIDELRFVPNTANLSPRWPFAADDRELIYVAPDAVPPAAKRFAFPAGWDVDAREELKTTDAVALLQSAIERQINARDHSLVEETDRVACYRPLFRGNASRGVEEELRHFAGLVKLGFRDGEVSVVLVPAVDRRAFARRTLTEDLIPGWRQNGLIQGPDSGVAQFIREIDAGDALADEVASGSVDALRTLLRNCSLSANPDSILGGGVLGPSAPAGRQAAEADLARQIQNTSVPYVDELADRGVVTIVQSDQLFYNAFGA